MGAEQLPLFGRAQEADESPTLVAIVSLGTPRKLLDYSRLEPLPLP